jgi:hypothetical protein
MNADRSLKEVVRLLGLMPGVKVVLVKQVPTMIWLSLVVSSPQSLVRLGHISLAANVTLAVEIDWEWRGDEDDPQCVRYVLKIPQDSASCEPPSTLEIVGIYVVRYLSKHALIPVNEVEELLQHWNSCL